MKRYLLLIAAGVLFYSTLETQAFIWSIGGEKIAKVADLPNTDEWMTEDGSHGDLSVIYKQAWILWIPIWNYDARYCGSTASSRQNTEYFTLTDGDSEFVSKYGSPEGVIPLWDRIGGKLVWALIILGGIGIKRMSSDEGTVIETDTATTQPQALGVPSPGIASVPANVPQQVLIMRNGQQFGPYPIAQAKAMLSNGELLAGDMAWYEGEADWKPLNQVPGIY